MDLSMVNPESFHLELKDEIKLLENLVEKGDFDEAEALGFTIYQSLKNRNL